MSACNVYSQMIGTPLYQMYMHHIQDSLRQEVLKRYGNLMHKITKISQSGSSKFNVEITITKPDGGVFNKNFMIEIIPSNSSSSTDPPVNPTPVNPTPVNPTPVNPNGYVSSLASAFKNTGTQLQGTQSGFAFR